MVVMLGDFVTASRELGDDHTIIHGRVSGIVLKDSGELKYFYIKGIDASFWMSDGWVFDDHEHEGEEDE